MVTPRRWRRVHSRCAYRSASGLSSGSTIWTPFSSSMPAVVWRMSSTGPSSTGSQMASSRRMAAACWTLGWCPSGKAMRVSFLRARLTTDQSTWWARLWRLRSCSTYSDMSMRVRATPPSMAALATAGATHSSTRWSNGLGMMYWRPNWKRSPP